MSSGEVETIMNEFARRFKDARQRAGYDTAVKLAKKLGISKERINHWERGRAMPRLDQIPRLCHVLGVTPDDLIPMMPTRRVGAKKSRPSVA